MRRTKRPAESLDTLTAAWVRDHNGKEAVTVAEAAEMLSVHPQTIYRRVYAGKLRYTPDKRVSMRDLCAYANGF